MNDNQIMTTTEQQQQLGKKNEEDQKKLEQNLKGIDISEALQILAERTKTTSLPLHPTNDDIPSKEFTKGQTIHLVPPALVQEIESENEKGKKKEGVGGKGKEEERKGQDKKEKENNDENKNKNHKTTPSFTEEERRQLLKEEREKRLTKIKNELQLLTVKELLQAIIKAQEERVITYNRYETGLKKVLETNNFTEYPILCAQVTASFSVLSDTVNTIRSVMNQQIEDVQKDKDGAVAKKKQKSSLSSYLHLLTNLQKHEKEKLNFTAAYHLERIRANDESNNNGNNSDCGSSSSADIDNNDNNNNSDDRIEKLLQQGMKTLRTDIHTCIDNINEILEEVRYAIMEETEREEDDE